MQTEQRQNIFTEENNRYKVCKDEHKKATNQFERGTVMKKEYVSPKVDVIKTRLESELLAGSNGVGGVPSEPGSAKAYGGDLDDFTDESMWGDETDVNN